MRPSVKDWKSVSQSAINSGAGFHFVAKDCPKERKRKREKERERERKREKER
jgi:hypothetical protein